MPGKLFEEAKTYPDWVGLAIRFDSISLLNDVKENLFALDLDDMTGMISYSSAIVFEFGDERLRLDSLRSFEIYQLIDEYLKIKIYMNLKGVGSD